MRILPVFLLPSRPFTHELNMKKTIFTKATLMLLVCAVGFTACKKDKEEKVLTNSEKIVATWKQDFSADDLNENGTMEESEKEYPAAGDYEYVTFNSNGTLKDSLNMSGFELVTPGTWTISGDQITVTILGTTSTGTLQQLDGSRLTVKDNETPTSWTSYIKQ